MAAKRTDRPTVPGIAFACGCMLYRAASLLGVGRSKVCFLFLGIRCCPRAFSLTLGEGDSRTCSVIPVVVPFYVFSSRQDAVLCPGCARADLGCLFGLPGWGNTLAEWLWGSSDVSEASERCGVFGRFFWLFGPGFSSNLTCVGARGARPHSRQTNLCGLRDGFYHRRLVRRARTPDIWLPVGSVLPLACFS